MRLYRLSKFNNVHNIGSQTTHPSFSFKAVRIKGHEKGRYKYGGGKCVPKPEMDFSRHVKESNKDLLSLFERNEKWTASKQKIFLSKHQRTHRK